MWLNASVFCFPWRSKRDWTPNPRAEPRQVGLVAGWRATNTHTRSRAEGMPAKRRAWLASWEGDTASQRERVSTRGAWGAILLLLFATTCSRSYTAAKERKRTRNQGSQARRKEKKQPISSFTRGAEEEVRRRNVLRTTHSRAAAAKEQGFLHLIVPWGARETIWIKRQWATQKVSLGTEQNTPRGEKKLGYFSSESLFFFVDGPPLSCRVSSPLMEANFKSVPAGYISLHMKRVQVQDEQVLLHINFNFYDPALRGRKEIPHIFCGQAFLFLSSSSSSAWCNVWEAMYDQ